MYSYEQAFEMELGRWRMMASCAWIAHWDLDEWICLPAFTINKKCLHVETLGDEENDAVARHFEQHGAFRDVKRFPLRLAHPDRDAG